MLAFQKLSAALALLSAHRGCCRPRLWAQWPAPPRYEKPSAMQYSSLKYST